MPRHRRPAHPAAATAARAAGVAVATGVLVGGGLAAPLGPASAHHVQPQTATTFFHCTAGQKVANLEKPASWDGTAPTSSVTGGAGCGQADLANLNATVGPADVSSFRATGTYTGLLRDLTVRLDDIYVGSGRAGGAQPLKVSLWVNDQQRLKEATVTVTPTRSSTGASESFLFSVAMLGLTDHETDNKTHTITLHVEGSQAANAWVYDTTEVPGGIVFNPAELQPTPTPSDPA